MKTNWEMADGNDPEAIITATQNAVLTMMQNIIRGMKEDYKTPGLTWEQLDYFFDEMKKKKPTVITQERPQ